MKKKIFYLIVFIEVLVLIYLGMKVLSNYPIRIVGKFIYKENDVHIPLNQPFRKISENPNLYVELIPNIKTKFNGELVEYDRITTIEINSDGFRDIEYTIEKPPNTVRIIALGDSFTFGFGVELNESWPKILEMKLNELESTVNYEVLNFGVPGYSTKNEIEMFKLKGLKYSPDMVIIGYVENDLLDEFNVNCVAEKIKQNYPELKNKNREEIIKNSSLYRTLIDINKRAYEEVWNDIKKKPFREAWKVIESPLDELKNITTQNKIKVIIVAFPSSHEQIEALKNISNKYSWDFIDSSEFLSKYPTEKLIIHPLDSHPNSFEHELVGVQIFNYLIKHSLVPF